MDNTEITREKLDLYANLKNKKQYSRVPVPFFSIEMSLTELYEIYKKVVFDEDERQKELTAELKKGLIKLLNKGEKLNVVVSLNNFIQENNIVDRDTFIEFYVDLFVNKCQNMTNDNNSETVDIWMKENNVVLDKERLLLLVAVLPLMIRI